MTIKAILFDKDGTLLQFDATFLPATSKVIKSLSEGDTALAKQIAELVKFDIDNVALAPSSVLIAGSVDDIAVTLMPLLKYDSVAELSKRVNALYVEHSLSTVVGFDFLTPTLDKLKIMGLPLGVATNDTEEGAYSHLNKLEVAERFCFIAGFDSGFGAKPEPGMVLGFADHLGFAPEEIMMVGDSTHDCHSGRAAGAIVIGVTSGGAEAEELAPHADYVLPSIAELPDLIAKLNA
ncbi:MAG: HAD family hydrolase [Rhizobiaceae bacterium]